MKRALFPLLPLLLALASCTQAEPPAAAAPTAGAERPAKIVVRATLERVEKIDSTPFCSQGENSTCEAFVLHLSNPRPKPACRFIAINYIDDTGHRYVRWPETLVITERAKWTLVGQLYPENGCFYGLLDAR